MGLQLAPALDGDGGQGVVLLGDDVRGLAPMAGNVQRIPVPADAVADYVRYLDGGRFKVATLTRRMSAISVRHKLAGHPSPTADPQFREFLAGVRRAWGERGRGAPRKARAATTALVRAGVEALDLGSPKGARDAALLVMGLAGGFRRSELVGLDVADVTETTDGLAVLLRRSKTDQEGKGRTVGLPFGSRPSTCPVRAWRRWLAVSGVVDGPAFRPVDRHGNVGPTRLGVNAVRMAVKAAAIAAGVDPEPYSGHSLLATEAARAGVPERVIARQTGHRSIAVLGATSRRGRCSRRTRRPRSDCDDGPPRRPRRCGRAGRLGALARGRRLGRACWRSTGHPTVPVAALGDHLRDAHGA